MKNLYIILVCLFASFSSVQAQYEFGAAIGGALYYGELAPGFGSNLSNTKLSIGLFGKYHFDENIAVRVQWLRNSLGAADRNFDDSPGLVNRNLDFQSTLNEYAIIPEYSFYHKRFGFDNKFSAYAALGIGFYTHDPKALYEGELVSLQPLGTEGQGLLGNEDLYSLNGVSIPFGLGVKVALSKQITVGLEMINSLTFTDYLDDVSGFYPNFELLNAERGQIAVDLSNRTLDGSIPNRRGNPDTNDWYGVINFTVSYAFGNEVEKTNKRKTSKRRKK